MIFSRSMVVCLLLIFLGLAGCRPDAAPTSTAIPATSTALPSPSVTVSPSPTATSSPVPTPTPISIPTPTSTLEVWVSYWPSGQTPSLRGYSPNQITALVVAPSDGQTVYAATWAALFRSIDGGKNWTMVNSLPNLEADFIVLTRALAVDPLNRDSLFAYFWPKAKAVDAPPELKGFKKSTDGGRSWSDPSSGASADLMGLVNTLVVNPSNPNIIMVGTDRYNQKSSRILRSTDGGATWQVTYTIDPVMGVGNITTIAIHPTSPNIVYAGHKVYHGGSVIRSDDGGISWRFTATVPMPLSYPVGLALDPSDPNVVYVAYQALVAAGVAVYKSSDGGQSWIKASSGLPEGTAGAGQLIIDPSDPKVLFFAIQGLNGGIYITRDGADSWVRLTPDDAPQFAHVTSLSYSASEHTLFAGTNEGVWQSRLPP